MRLKVFKGVDKEQKVTLSLQESDSGIYVVIVAENGDTLNHLCQFMNTGTLRLISAVDPRFGFSLDSAGCINIENQE